MDSCRDLFRECLFSSYDTRALSDPTYLKQGGNSKGREIEVMMPEDLIMKFENQLNYQIKDHEKEALNLVFGQAL
jgi:hypothetical protein